MLQGWKMKMIGYLPMASTTPWHRQRHLQIPRASKHRLHSTIQWTHPQKDRDHLLILLHLLVLCPVDRHLAILSGNIKHHGSEQEQLSRLQSLGMHLLFPHACQHLLRYRYALAQ